MSEKLWYKVVRNFVKAGKMPLPANDTAIEILKTIITEEQAKFVLSFKKSSYNSEEIKSLTDLDENALDEMLNDLMHIGAVTGIPSRSTGIMVYRLAPFFPGLLEFTLMRGETNETTKKLASLWKDYFKGMVDGTQKNYDKMMEIYKKLNPLERIVPVEEEIDVKQERVFAFEELTKIIEEQEVIGLATCYCRHRKDLIDEPCKKTNERENCFMLGRTATFLISQGFAKPITKEKTLAILKESEEAGLVHKAFHTNLDPERELDGLCNCCQCCCGTFDNHFAGAIPLLSLSSYLAKVIEEDCVGCGICVDKCNSNAMTIVNDISVIDESRCLGCGLCAYHCPNDAIKLERIEPRKVFVPPPRLNS